MSRQTTMRALVQAGSVVLFAVLPALALAHMLQVGLSQSSFAVDFHHELYPQFALLLDGANPYPSPDFDPKVGGNYIWPPAVGLLVAPFTALPLAVAEIAFALLGVVVFVGALWVAGLRDWRAYGACLLWPQVAGEMRVAHLTPMLALLAAIAWRHRRSTVGAGLAVGTALALKFFAWPLAVWLAARRQWGAALLAMSLGAASFVSVSVFASLEDYARALSRLGSHFDQDAYTVFALLAQLGVHETGAHVVGFLTGAIVLGATWRYRSFTLGVAAALMLSPIVWLDYFALAAIPLAIVRPRLSLLWMLPVLTWGAPGTGLGIGEPFQIARVLGVFAVLFALTSRAEIRGRSTADRHAVNRAAAPSSRPSVRAV